jgi:hypothetical protein
LTFFSSQDIASPVRESPSWIAVRQLAVEWHRSDNQVKSSRWRSLASSCFSIGKQIRLEPLLLTKGGDDLNRQDKAHPFGQAYPKAEAKTLVKTEIS